ncbi:MAG: hypothetical protein COB02_18555 [Candidatus Cloacimonadota bacterium]|nr:MAG: hypothetical protein COB02_18555 [Candidatus Cloacimonadota bacterium]
MNFKKFLLAIIVGTSLLLSGCGLSSSTATIGALAPVTNFTASDQAVRDIFQSTSNAAPQAVAADFSFNTNDSHATYAHLFN